MPKRKKRSGRRYYRLKNKIRIHGYNPKTGRYGIIGYRNIENLDDRSFESGSFRIIEYTFSYIPTNKSGRASGIKDFEVRIRMPEGMTGEARELADRTMVSLCGSPMTNTADKGLVSGLDFIKYSDDDTPQWAVMDLMHKNLKYPKQKQWGTVDDLS